MASFVIEDIARDSLGDALNALLNNGVLVILEGATSLVELTLPPSANNTSTNGVITFAAIPIANAANAGNANLCKFYNANKANLIATGDVGVSGNTCVLNNINIAANQTVNITSANITVPSGA